MYQGRGRGYPGVPDDPYDVQVYDWSASAGPSQPRIGERWTAGRGHATSSNYWSRDYLSGSAVPSASLYQQNYQERYYSNPGIPDPYGRYSGPAPYAEPQLYPPAVPNGYSMSYQPTSAPMYTSTYCVAPPPTISYPIELHGAFPSQTTASRPTSLVEAPASWEYSKSLYTSPQKPTSRPKWEDYLKAGEGASKQKLAQQSRKTPDPDDDWAIEEIDYSKLCPSRSSSSNRKESQLSSSRLPPAPPAAGPPPPNNFPSPPPLRLPASRPSPSPSPQTASSTSSHCSSPPRITIPPPPPPNITSVPKSSLSLNEILPDLTTKKPPASRSLKATVNRKRTRNGDLKDDDNNDDADLIDLLGKKTKSRVSASARNYARPSRKSQTATTAAAAPVILEPETSNPKSKAQANQSQEAVPEPCDTDKDEPVPSTSFCDKTVISEEADAEPSPPHPVLRIRTDIFEEDEAMEEGEES